MNINLRKIFMLMMCMAPLFLMGQTFTGTGNPQSIPVTGTGGFPCTGGPTTSVATVAGLGGTVGATFAITSVEINLTHTWDSDLEIDLISPDGTIWDLSSDNGGSGDNYTNTVFMDGAPSITTGSPPFTGTFQAEEGPFATGFAGDAIDGDWTLSICDDAGGDSGTLLSYEITFGEICQIVAPASPIILDNTPGLCGSEFSLVVDASSCSDPVTNDFSNGGDTAEGFYPVGTTTVTFTSGAAEVSVDVIVNDTEGPTVNCPNDIIVNLDAGECEAVLDFAFNVTDNCPLTNEISYTTNNVFDAGSITNSVACPGGGYQTLNVYNLAAAGLNNTVFTGADFGVFQTFGAPEVTVNLYSIPFDPAGAGFLYSDLTLEATGTVVLPGGGSSVQSVVFDAPSAELSGMVVVEHIAPFGSFTNGFLPGYNNQGLTEGVTYLASNFCGVPNPEPVGNILGGFTDVFMVQLNGLQAADVEGTLIAGLPSGSAFPIGTTSQVFEFEDVAGNVTVCAFDVTVNEFANPIEALACNDNVNISADENCEVVLSADIFLEGGPYGCYEEYEVYIWPFGNESQALGPFTGSPVVALPLGTHVAEIVDPETGNRCWGEFTVEDKIAPVLECSNYTVNCLNEDARPGSPSLESATAEIGTITTQDNTVLTESFNVADAGDLSSAGGASVTLSSNHTWVGDLVVTVTAPNGNSAELINNIGGPGFGCAGNGLELTFNDSGAAYSVLDGTCNNNPAAEGTFQASSGSIAALFAGGYAGSWTVSVEDLVGGDGGDVTLGLELGVFGEVPLPIPAGASATQTGPNTYTVNGLDACGPATLSYSDAPAGDDCTDGTTIRTWVVEDASGNVGESCSDTITVERIGIADILLPPALIELPCGNGTDPEDIVAFFDNPLTADIPLSANCTIDVVERNEGIPYGWPHYLQLGCDNNLHPQRVDNNICNIYATYTDQEIPACGPGCNGNVKVIRTWTLLDWCTNETVDYTQLIKAVDNEGPTFGLMDITVSTDPWGCEANINIPQPWELHDACTDDLTYTVTGPAGVIIVGDAETGYTALGAPKGVHTFTYTASDCCGNVTSTDATFTVVDATPPVAVAKQNIVISLTSSGTSNDGLAKLYAESVDNGSHDGCTGIKLEVRRDEDICDIRGNDTYNADGHPQDGSPNPNSPSYDPDGGAYVKFCCEDITNASYDVDGDGENDPGYVRVWLRVWDDGDTDGVFGSAGDNYNETWAYVKVEDKLAPAIVCPPDVTLTCDMDYTDLNMTGSAQGYASCGGIDVEYNDIIVNLNSCNEGFVRRRWSVVGRSDIFCDQNITMEGIDAPVNVSFSQVQDFTAANCPDMISVGEPTWIAGPCDVLGYTVETDTFRFEDGACYKLVNHWTVINWCDYEPNNPFWDGEGLWEHIQVIKVTDETKPVIEDCEDKMFEINDHSDSDNDGDVCEAKITLTNVATDEGSDNCPTGWLKWQVFVDLWGDGTDDLEYSSFLPPFDSQFNDTNGNGIPDVYLSPTANGETVSVPLPDIAGSMSNHKVYWKVTDGCNNVTTCDYEFMVVDKKAPTPYCVSLSTAVMDMGPDGEPGVELWAEDFNVGSFDNCTDQENLLYSFSGTAYVPNRTFTCEDVANSPVEVQMYVWDEKGNNDFCTVFLTIVDNQGLCEDGGSRPDVAGDIATAVGTPVNDVEVTLEANIVEYPKAAMTDDAGHYAFVNNVASMDYEITASKDVDYLNGVSTLDLVKIQRHILGLESLDSPYKLIAADVNADDQIKASDLTQLRKLILGVITDLPTNESWRFVDANQALTMESDLADVDYVVNINNLQDDQMNNEMVAVKVGDVTDNAVANLTAENIEVRSSKVLTLSIAEQSVEAGDVVEVEFTSEDFANVYGYQFTMELNGLEFAGVQSGVVAMTEGNVGVLSSDIVTVSYSNSEARTAGTAEAVFTATFVATETGNLSEMIDVTSKVTTAEAYVGETYEIRDVVIETRDANISVDATELFQNEPNPFRTQTVVGFNLAEAASATITVFDVTGKIIVRNTINGVKGYNTVNFNANELGTSGVLYYTLESGEFTATKKMIIIE